jgi:hypothetical protein
MTRESNGADLDREEGSKDTGYMAVYEYTRCSYLSLKLIYDVSDLQVPASTFFILAFWKTQSACRPRVFSFN